MANSATLNIDEVRLLEGVGMNRHLVARCGCGRSAPCDPTPWVAEGLGAMSLRAFSPRLRCVCGSRSAALEIQPGPRPDEAQRDIYVFR